MNLQNHALSSQQLSLITKYLDDTLVCPILLEPFTFPHISPCGHTFDYSSICQSLENKPICPLDRHPLTDDRLVENLFVKALLERQYKCPITQALLFEAVKLPCGHTFSKSGITTWAAFQKYCPIDYKKFELSEGMDDKDTFISKLFEVIICPLSKKVIETPVIGPCGHTFEAASIHDQSICPHDKMKLKPMVPNRIASDILKYFTIP